MPTGTAAQRGRGLVRCEVVRTLGLCKLTVGRRTGALNEAVHLGYKDTQWMDDDPDLKNIRTDPRYKRIRRQLELKFSDP